jgi:tetratricopeptide (TPR) repeat protein
MHKKMPSRPKSHDNEVGSRRAFENAIPTNWTFTPPEGDYGIDGDVEVFGRGSATGIHFRVQLKSVERLRGAPKVRIKQTTRNYWAELDVPTLVILWDATSTQMWWEWAHLIDDWKARPGAETVTVNFTREWDTQTPEEILSEVRSFRALRNFGAGLPIYVSISTTAAFLGQRPGPMVARTQKVLSRSRDLTFIKSLKKDLELSIQFTEDSVAVRLSGSHPRYVHYSGPLDSELTESIIANIMISAAFALGGSGLTSTATSLLASAVEKASSIFREDLIGRMIPELVRAHETAALRLLLKRTYLQNESPVRPHALVSISASADELHPEEIRLIVGDFRAAARTMDDEGAVLYNAAGLLRHQDPVEALSLYRAAAIADSRYLQRGYWWREQGETAMLAGDYLDAVSKFEEALSQGDSTASGPLGDALLELGEYERAVDIYQRLAEDEALTDTRWRVRALAFDYLVQRFGIKSQTRDSSGAEALWALETDGNLAVMAEAALAADLLSPNVLWAITQHERAEGRPTLQLYLAASELARDVPVLWEESLRAAFAAFPPMSVEIVECIKRYCRDEFIAFLHDDAGVSDEDRAHILFMLDFLPEPDPNDMVLRNHNDDGTSDELRLNDKASTTPEL